MENKNEYPWIDALGDYAVVPVHPKERRTLTNQFLVFTGVLACIAALWGGGALGTQLDVKGLTIASIAGSAIVAVIGGLTAYIGGTARTSTYVNLSRPFGRFGGFLWGLTAAGITCGIGWFAVETWLFGVMIHDLAPNAWWADVGVASLWGGLLMMTTAIIGYSGLAFLSYLTVPLFLILAGVSFAMGAYTGGGLHRIFTLTPPNPVPLSAAITTVVGLYIAGATITADVGRFARRAKDPVIAWVLQVMIIMPYFLIGVGVLTLAMGGTRITEALLAAGAGLGAYAMAIFGQWTTNDNNLYSGALNWTLIIPLKKRVITAIEGIIGTAIAAYVGFSAGASLDPFINFLNILGKFVPAVGGVLIADFYIYQAYKGVPLTERYKLKIGEKIGEVNWVGWISAILGGIIGGWYISGIAALNSLILGVIIYSVLSILCDKIGIPLELGKFEVTEYGLAPRWIVERHKRGGSAMTDPAFEKRIYHLFILSTILAIIGIILTAPIWPKNAYAGILWPMISVPIFLTSVIGAFRMQRAKTPEEKATYAIQHSWWILSLGFSGLLLFPAQFFREAGGANAIVMTLFSILWTIFGIVGVYEPHAETGISITV